MALAGLDEQRLKQMAISLWRQGGMDSLVKVSPRGRSPDDALNIGYCTTFKYVVGRTPAEMEAVVGLRSGSKLAFGARIFLVRPLPGPTQFRLSGYTQTPEGISAAAKTPHPDYPPGLGAPQWELVGHSQKALLLLAEVPPGQKFAYPVAKLPVPI
jgi:hypothetical protein